MFSYVYLIYVPISNDGLVRFLIYLFWLSNHEMAERIYGLQIYWHFHLNLLFHDPEKLKHHEL